jgi:hypothetical protein
MAVPISSQDLDFQRHIFFLLFAVCSVSSVISDCLFCWFWWNTSLFTLSFHNTSNFVGANFKRKLIFIIIYKLALCLIHHHYMSHDLRCVLFLVNPHIIFETTVRTKYHKSYWLYIFKRWQDTFRSISLTPVTFHYMFH